MKVNQQRKTGPPINAIGKIPKLNFDLYKLDNDILVYEVNAGSQDVIKVEVIHKGGRLLEDKRLTSRATAYMLKEESQLHTSEILAEKIDFLGASISSRFSLDFTTLTAISMGKYYQEILDLVAEVIFLPKFSANELERYVQRNINNLKIELQKNDVKAYRELTEILYGEDHIYGYNSTQELYQQLKVQDCQKYYDDYIGTDNAIIILSGKKNDRIRHSLNQTLGKRKKTTFSKKYIPPATRQERIVQHLPGGGELQSSIMIGRRLFTKKHDDYAGMVILNTVLGGYFGSRLMKKLREELGLTYGVNSIIEMLKNDGFLYINTEIDPQYKSTCCDLIYHEIERLQHDLISEKELMMVKNYILGNILNMLDGPFRSAKWVKSQVMHDLTMEQGEELFSKIADQEANDIRELAQKYFNKSDLTELIVG